MHNRELSCKGGGNRMSMPLKEYKHKGVGSLVKKSDIFYPGSNHPLPDNKLAEKHKHKWEKHCRYWLCSRCKLTKNL
jgi:hypothetical protein